jgi:copper chaperone CopZ
MTTTLRVHCPEIECEGCAGAIQRALGALAGVDEVEVDVKTKGVAVQYDAARVSEATLRERLSRAGFPSQ